MRTFALLLIHALPAWADEAPRKLPVRYGVALTEQLVEAYPQTDPKIAVDSAIKLLEAKRYDLFAAHFLDPNYFDEKVIDRSKGLEEKLEGELIALREDQRRNPSAVANIDRLPLEPKAFQDRVHEEAIKRGFALSVRDMADRFKDYPEVPRTFRKMWRSGDLSENGAAAQFTHKDFPGQTLFLKKVGDRWMLEGRQAEEAKP